jgi:hypothetical protein
VWSVKVRQWPCRARTALPKCTDDSDIRCSFVCCMLAGWPMHRGSWSPVHSAIPSALAAVGPGGGGGGAALGRPGQVAGCSRRRTSLTRFKDEVYCRDERFAGSDGPTVRPCASAASGGHSTRPAGSAPLTLASAARLTHSGRKRTGTRAGNAFTPRTRPRGRGRRSRALGARGVSRPARPPARAGGSGRTAAPVCARRHPPGPRAARAIGCRHVVGRWDRTRDVQITTLRLVRWQVAVRTNDGGKCTSHS